MGRETGGAEVLWGDLERGLREIGVSVDLVEVPCDESSYDAMLRSYAACYDLNLDKYDLVISTKAPTYMVRHRNHVALLVHTPRVFYDRFESEFPRPTSELVRQRDEIRAMDLAAFSGGKIRRRFAIGRPVVRRLEDADPRWKELPFEIVTLPPRRRPREVGATVGEHYLLPGRLHRWKRVDLAIEAVRSLSSDVPLVITGTGEDEERFRAAAGNDPRIRFRGHVSEESLDELYAAAIAVPFVPLDEDFGYVTVEAFAHGRPVVTCSDSGEPAEIVRRSGGGIVVDPTPAALAAALEELRSSPDRARELGRRGASFVADLSRAALARTLLEAGGISVAPSLPVQPIEPIEPPDLTLAVLDTQPIAPPIGGGRLRLHGLYRTLDEHTRAVYVGSFDWRGPGRRRVSHAPRLEEHTVPHSEEQFTAADSFRRMCDDATVIDVTQPFLAALSPELLDEARRAMERADVVIFSHPWLWPPLSEDVRRLGVPVIYDSHNVEWRLRKELLAGTPMGRALAENVRYVEADLCRYADLVLACSREDRDAFLGDFGLEPSRVEIVPNGVDTTTITPPDEERRRAARSELHVPDGAIASIFIGSAYGPNVDAAEWLAHTLAPAMPEHRFLLVGGVGDVLKSRRPHNLDVLGPVDRDGLLRALSAADVALNPVPHGSGTNIKMFDFMAAGLPIVSTPAGGRGIDPGSPEAYLVREWDDFAPTLRELSGDPARRAELGGRARALACAEFDWASASRRVAGFARRLRRSPATVRTSTGPAVSVVVPTFDRPEQLATLLSHLQSQSFRDFEVIVVDQSPAPVDSPGTAGLAVRHVTTPIRGAVRARNTGIALANADLLAFIDDDCLPDPDWLAAIVDAFRDGGVVAVEGLIVPDAEDASAHRMRVVKNEGFEGLGFMTANLAARRREVERIGGFDEIFDHPHFREDTDFGWRLQRLGEIPFVREALVVHPVMPRSDPRESAATRVRFFEKDPVLFEKHPSRYPGLFIAEGHYRKTAGFWEAFRHGIEKYAVEIPAAGLLEHDLVDGDAIPDWFRELAR